MGLIQDRAALDASLASMLTQLTQRPEGYWLSVIQPVPTFVEAASTCCELLETAMRQELRGHLGRVSSPGTSVESGSSHLALAY